MPASGVSVPDIPGLARRASKTRVPTKGNSGNSNSQHDIPASRNRLMAANTRRIVSTNMSYAVADYIGRNRSQYENKYDNDVDVDVDVDVEEEKAPVTGTAGAPGNDKGLFQGVEEGTFQRAFLLPSAGGKNPELRGYYVGGLGGNGWRPVQSRLKAHVILSFQKHLRKV